MQNAARVLLLLVLLAGDAGRAHAGENGESSPSDVAPQENVTLITISEFIERNPPVYAKRRGYFPKFPHVEKDVEIFATYNPFYKIYAKADVIYGVVFAAPGAFSERLQDLIASLQLERLQAAEDQAWLPQSPSWLPGSGSWRMTRDPLGSESAQLQWLALDVTDYYHRAAVLFSLERSDSIWVRPSLPRYPTWRTLRDLVLNRKEKIWTPTITPHEADIAQRLVQGWSGEDGVATVRIGTRYGSSGPIRYWPNRLYAQPSRERMKAYLEEYRLPAE